MKQLIVIDYQEGAGGEFLSSFISAHFGHKLVDNSQENPNFLQKWINSHSLALADWDTNFSNHLEIFLQLCKDHNVDSIAIPYHLYKWPHHATIFKKQASNTRFVKINAQGFEDRIRADFQRKVWDKPLIKTQFNQIAFLLKDQSQERKKFCLDLFKQNKLTMSDLIQGRVVLGPEILPSDDVEVSYDDFFNNFSNTPNAYEQLCAELDLIPDLVLLGKLIERNTKNLQTLQTTLSTL